MIRQVEWYRDNNSVYYRLRQRIAWGGFYLPQVRQTLSVTATDRIKKCSKSPSKRNLTMQLQHVKGVYSMKAKQMTGKQKKAVTKASVLGMMAVLSVMATGCGTSEEAEGKDDMYTIGIIQFAEHGSLDHCREGFVEGLEQAGLEEGVHVNIEVKNAAADMGTSAQITGQYVSEGVDMICAIATPAAQAAYNAAMDSDIPVIYTAVTDPKAAELSDKDGNPVGEITGTSDILPIKEQLELIRTMLPDAKKVGILYTTSEVNSVSAVETYETLAQEYGFEIVAKGVSTASEIPLAADALIEKVDCMTNLTDNTVVNSLASILEKANEAKIPVFGSEVEQVKMGCLAAEGLDYVALGRQTGSMAAKVLKGEAKASEMAYETITEPSLYLNTKAAEALGIAITEELKEGAE